MRILWDTIPPSAAQLAHGRDTSKTRKKATLSKQTYLGRT